RAVAERVAEIELRRAVGTEHLRHAELVGGRQRAGGEGGGRGPRAVAAEADVQRAGLDAAERIRVRRAEREIGAAVGVEVAVDRGVGGDLRDDRAEETRGPALR